MNKEALNTFRHGITPVISDYDRKKTHRLYRSSVMITSGGFIKARQYDHDILQLRPGLKELLVSLPSPDAPAQAKEGRQASKDDGMNEISKNSLNRTRDSLIAYASEHSKDWHSFVTLTFKEEVTDVKEANKSFRYFIDQWRRKKPDFMYLGVPEFQKNGRVHYHLLTNLVCGTDFPKCEKKTTFNKEKNKETDLEYYDLPYWGYGFSSAFDINTADDKFNVALYITKYLFKDVDDRLFGHNKILKSNNLRKPKIYYLLSDRTYTEAIKYLLLNGYEVSTYQNDQTKPFEVGYTQDSAFMVKPVDLEYVQGLLEMGCEFQGALK